jgi:hypothetical protein
MSGLRADRPLAYRHIVDRRRGGARGLLWAAWLALAIGALAGSWAVSAGVYRRQHCVLFLGHWLAVDRPTSAFCE